MNANNEDITSRNENEHRAIVNAVLEKALWIHQQQREGDGTQDSSSSACKPEDPPKIHLPGNPGQSTALGACGRNTPIQTSAHTQTHAREYAHSRKHTYSAHTHTHIHTHTRTHVRCAKTHPHSYIHLQAYPHVLIERRQQVV